MTTPNPQDEGAMRRLKKLMALALDPAAAPGEAANAMRMAQNLMAKHGFTEGAVASSEIDEFTYDSTKAVKPPPWEGRLLQELGRAFGSRCYWSPGAGPRGFKQKGKWVILAEKRKLELVQYAFDVIRRQLIKERAKFVASLPEYYTRPRKADEGDVFGLSFVEALAKKISDLSDQDPAVTQALADRVTAVCGGHKVKQRGLSAGFGAREAGAAAGAKASLHRPMNGGSDVLRIG